jgi:hypothetical protein
MEHHGKGSAGQNYLTAASRLSEMAAKKLAVTIQSGFFNAAKWVATRYSGKTAALHSWLPNE